MNSKFPIVACMVAAAAGGGAALVAMSGAADSSSAGLAAVSSDASAGSISERAFSNIHVNRVRRLVADSATFQVKSIEFYTSLPPQECEGHVELEQGPDGTFEIVSFDCVNECGEHCNVCDLEVDGYHTYWCECSDQGCISPPV